MTSIPPRTPRPSRLAPLSLSVLLLACGSVHDRQPLPAELMESAQVPGIPEARTWGDRPVPMLERWIKLSDARLREIFSGVYGREVPMFRPRSTAFGKTKASTTMLTTP